MKVVYAERARQDIADIYGGIAEHSRAAAQRVEDTIRATCEGLALFLFASAATDDPNVRRMPLVRYPYTIFFRVDEPRAVEIAHVIHSARARDLRRMPDER